MKTFAVYKCSKTGSIIAKPVKKILTIPASYVKARNPENAIALARVA